MEESMLPVYATQHQSVIPGKGACHRSSEYFYLLILTVASSYAMIYYENRCINTNNRSG